ncbi:MAG: hypothetical protein GSR73_06015 [Desulfurococcales archaeon]|nr:hypothetical protein [Desulfurococcales archaeon]
MEKGLRELIKAITMTTAITLLLATTVAQAYQQGTTPYPCSTCHATMKQLPETSYSAFHGINLTGGAHAGLYCTSCHDPGSNMMALRGGVNITKLLFSKSSQERMDVAKTCAVCHVQIYKDWLNLAHGNTTFTCLNGDVTEVIGYKGVRYYQHECPPGSTYTPAPAKSCIDCHDPHHPTMYPLNPLPKPSHRPEPPDESGILYGGIAVVAVGVALILAAPLVHFKKAPGR